MRNKIITLLLLTGITLSGTHVAWAAEDQLLLLENSNEPAASEEITETITDSADEQSSAVDLSETYTTDSDSSLSEEQTQAPAYIETDEPDTATTEPAEENDTPLSETIWVEPGNTSAAILAGGWYLLVDDGMYYFDGGLWYSKDSGDQFLGNYNGANLNLVNDWLYFTDDSCIYRLPQDGGMAELILEYDCAIDQCYVMGTEIRFLADGIIVSYNIETDTLSYPDVPGSVTGFIPTPYGNICLTGQLPSFSL